MDKRIIILDNSNIFLSNYIINPTLSHDGEPCGGLIGSLKSLQKFVREVKPDKIVVCWDGPGGSRRRKLANKDYKEGRSPIRLNWDIDHTLSDDEKFKNKVWQLNKLFDYYSMMPIYQFIYDDIEADDIIAHVAKLDMFEKWQKILVSSDKDFIQLLDNRTILYRPAQKQILNTKKVVEIYGIHPDNFTLARAISSDDKSDNIQGVERVGLKTVAKRFPFLSEEKSYTIDDIVNCCEKQKKKLKVHENILGGKDIIKANYSLIQLFSPQISIHIKDEIRNILQNKKLTFKKTDLIVQMAKDGTMGDYALDSLFRVFRIIADQK
jgi:DNA polymerase I